MSEQSIYQKIFDAIDLAILAETGVTLNWREAVELRGYIKSLEEAYVLEGNDYRAELARRDEELALTEKKLCNIDRSARAEVARRDEKLKITDGLLKEATETIGAVIACCTYNSNDDAKIGIYGIDQKAFTRIDQFITHYNDAVSAGKVSVDVKTSTDNNKGE